MALVTTGARRPIRLRAMRTFQAILQLGSVTAGARALGLTQPAASRMLAQLEQDLGFELFYRDRGRLIPTQDGLLLYEEVERALDNVDRVQELARDISDFRVGSLRLVAPPSFLEAVLPDVIADFLDRYPRVHLSIDSHGVETAKNMIAARAVDAGFVKLPLNRDDLEPRTVLVSGTACVLARDHPLAALSEITAHDLKNTPLVLLGQGRRFRSQVEAAFAEASVFPRVRVETHTVASSCAMAARGVGVAIVNERLAQAYVRDQTVLRPFKPTILHEYAFVTSRSIKPSRLAEAFYDLAVPSTDLSAKPARPA